MKQKSLKRAILLGLAMSVTVCSGVMAKDSFPTRIGGPIAKNYNESYSEDVTITNVNPDWAAIQIGHKDNDTDNPDLRADISISTTGAHTITIDSKGYGIRTENDSTGTIQLTSSKDNIVQFGSGSGISNNANGSSDDAKGVKITLQADNGTNSIITNGVHISGDAEKDNYDGINAGANNTGDIELTGAANKINVQGKGSDGIYTAFGSESSVTLTAKAQNGNKIKAGNNGIDHRGSGTVTLDATNAANTIDTTKGVGDGARIEGSGTIKITGQSNSIQAADDGLNIAKGHSGSIEVHSTAADNKIHGVNRGIHAEGGTVTVTADTGKNSVSGYQGIWTASGTVNLKATAGDNEVKGQEAGILAEAGTVTLNADQINYVSGGTVKTANAETRDAGALSFGDGYAVNASASGKTAKVEVSAAQNRFLGAVYASGKDASVQIGKLIGQPGENGSTGNTDEAKPTWGSSAFNYVASAAVISDAGDLNMSGNEEMKNKEVISALYAEGGADITVSGQKNEFRTTANPENENQLERVIWAYKGADINIDGTTLISTDSYEKSANSNDIAIAAGTAVGLSKKDDIEDNISDKDKAHVNLNYGAGSSVTGDIIAGYAGEVNINRKDAADDAGINIKGNLLAGNNGILNVDLGNGGKLEGRADDYGDAGVVTTDGYTNSFRHPAFSSGIYKGGVVNLTMGAGSTWNVTGQSWITRINTENAETVEKILSEKDPISAMNHMATIDLVYSNSNKNDYAHALTVYEMKGDAVFNMSLNGQRDISDMLYMKQADGNYIINVVDPVTTADMYAGDFTGLRFATVGKDSHVSFRAVTIGSGVLNVVYEVGTDSYNTSTENDAYNSTNGNGTGNTEKPGDAMVDNFFGSTGTPVDENTESDPSGTGIMMAAAEEEEDGIQKDNVTETTNYKLIGRTDEQFSDAGQTIIDMSKVNYSNAVYMDRLNKRMGEARYLEGDDGLWVRLRHDRIGKDNAFRSMNTMMELGYDRKVQSQKDGEHRRGVAFDYMRGTADYTNVMGDGDVRRAGVWLYDTWLGDKGHYTDYVVKYGRLSNEFNIFNELGTEVSGDYDNDVWSASAEYGRKKDIGNEWYFEPQAQLQYAYVTSADYTTNQGTKVELDGIDSLIGRAGFRLGRDTSEGNTVYFKADILHEFLGDQSIRAVDKTGVLSTTYENEGTWYDVGFGFSHRMGRDSYMFLDLEHSFGNDNDETYQINIGLSKAF